MTTNIVQSFDPVALIGGGELGKHDLEAAVARSTLLVAADGGASAALQAGMIPAAVIGDFDSISPEDVERIPKDRLFPIHDQQDCTDFDKALNAIDAPLVLAVGFLGGRVDHQLAAFHSLARIAPGACILIGQHELIFHAPASIALPLEADDVVSLFPMSPVTGQSSGLEWAIDGLEFAPAKRIGTSNRAIGPIQLDMNGPGMLVLVPRHTLDDVIRALRPAQSWTHRQARPAPMPGRRPVRA